MWKNIKYWEHYDESSVIRVQTKIMKLEDRTMKTRNIISIILVIAMSLMLVACSFASASGNDANENTDSNTNENTGNNTDSNTNPDSSTNGDGSETGGSEDGSSIGNSNQSNLSGTAEDVLNQILDAMNEAGISMPMALPPLAVAGDLSQNAIGLSESDFDRLVASAFYSQAAIATFAHQIIMIQAKDAAAAAEIKSLVSGENGYDAMKWVCVIPQSALVIESGEYVMIVASRNEVVDATLGAFEAAAGNTGDALTFFEHSDDGFGGGMGGGMAPMLPVGNDD